MKDSDSFGYDERRWDHFGYVTDEGCDLCGEKPAKVEPRFGYNSCKEHSTLSPVEFSQTKFDTISNLNAIGVHKEGGGK